MRQRRERAGVMDFVARQRTDLCGGNLGQRHGRAIERGELHGETRAALVDVHDRAHVARRQPMLRQVRGQRHTIEFSNHTSRG